MTITSPAATPCPHPPSRYYCGKGRDDRAPLGHVWWLACCDCGAILRESVDPYYRVPVGPELRIA